MIIEFNNLNTSNLIVDAVYKGGRTGNLSDDPISKLFPKLRNQVVSEKRCVKMTRMRLLMLFYIQLSLKL